MRAHTAADVLGNTFTNYYSPSLNETYHDLLSASDWVATDRINANTNQNFTSWGEFFGPHLDNGDNFTTTVCLPKTSIITATAKLMPFSNAKIFPAPSLMKWPREVLLCMDSAVAQQIQVNPTQVKTCHREPTLARFYYHYFINSLSLPMDCVPQPARFSWK